MVENAASERHGTARRNGSPAVRSSLRALEFGFCCLDLVIGVARKVVGFVALLTLGWTYFRLLVLGQSTHQLYPLATDPDLRQTLWVALLLIAAQGWDVSTEQLAFYWQEVRFRILGRPGARSMPSPARLPTLLHRPFRFAEPTIVRLGRFMDLCVAVANKVGAFAVLVYLVVLATQFAGGATVPDLYPSADDPWVSFLADLCVYVVVLGWWAMPFEAIAAFWRRLRQPLGSETV